MEMKIVKVALLVAATSFHLFRLLEMVQIIHVSTATSYSHHS